MNSIKTLLITSLLLSTTTLLPAQNISIKKNVVTIDGKECLNATNSDPNHVEITTLDGQQTILLNFIRTGYGPNKGLYTKVIFVEQNLSLTSQSYIFTKKLLIKKLIQDKVIVDCEVNEDQINKFILKYDEKIEDTLYRY